MTKPNPTSCAITVATLCLFAVELVPFSYSKDVSLNVTRPQCSIAPANVFEDNK